jgi:hypothetical protein
MADFSQLANDLFRLRSSYVNAKSLSANTAKLETIPAGYNMVFISATANIYAKFGDSSVVATIPGDTSDGSAAELNPSGYMLGKGDTSISVISDSSCVATFAYYKLGL